MQLAGSGEINDLLRDFTLLNYVIIHISSYLMSYLCRTLILGIKALGKQPNAFPGLSLKVLYLASYCSRTFLAVRTVLALSRSPKVCQGSFINLHCIFIAWIDRLSVFLPSLTAPFFAFSAHSVLKASPFRLASFSERGIVCYQFLKPIIFPGLRIYSL